MFAVDAMLGRLARWLRVLGFDTRYRVDIDDEDLLITARNSGAVILTRDTGLLARNDIGPACFVTHDRVEEQLVQVAVTLGLKVKVDRLFTRCLRCNGGIEAVSRKRVEGEVPDYVWRNQSCFSRCTSCGRIYWGGSHRARMLRKLRDLGLFEGA